MKLKIAVIIPNYNSSEITKKNVNLLYKQGNFFDIIVVDDKSTDNSLENLRKIKNLILLKNKTNKGCGASMNVGLDYCIKKKYDYAVLTDNDAFPVSKKLISSLITSLDNNKNLGFVVPTNEANPALQGGKIYGWMFHFFAIPCKVIKKVGKIDENYFIQIEDSDYSRRITKAGFDAFQIKEKYSHPDKPSSWIYPNFVYYTIRNSLYYNEKHTRGIKKIYNEIKIRAKAGIISAFSEITNLNLQEPIVLAINDYKQKKMGRNHYNFNKIEKQEFDQYLSPKELYLSKWEENKAFYVKEIIKKMLI